VTQRSGSNTAPDLLAGGEGLLSLPKNPTSALGLQPFGVAPLAMKNPGHAPGGKMW